MARACSNATAGAFPRQPLRAAVSSDANLDRHLRLQSQPLKTPIAAAEVASPTLSFSQTTDPTARDPTTPPPCPSLRARQQSSTTTRFASRLGHLRTSQLSFADRGRSYPLTSVSHPPPGPAHSQHLQGLRLDHAEAPYAPVPLRSLPHSRHSSTLHPSTSDSDIRPASGNPG
jgi:hypothetical protein